VICDAHDDDVIHICRSIATKLRAQDFLHHVVESGPDVTKAPQHPYKIEHSEGGCEPCFRLILLLHPHLVVAREAVKQT
jgi:hypothetical protein